MSGIWSAVAIGGSALIGGGLSLYGANEQAGAAKDAASAQVSEEQNALQAYQSALQKAAPLYAPYLNVGNQNLSTLAQLSQPGGYLYNPPNMTNFRQDPQYKNILNSALDAVRSSRSASGALYSGGTDEELMRVASQLADQAYQSIYARKSGEQNTLASRLGSLASMGPAATGSLASLYTDTAGNEANAFTNMGNAQAKGIIGAGDANASGLMGLNTQLQSGIGTGLNAYQSNLNRQSYDTAMQQQNDSYQRLIAALNPPIPSNYGGYSNGFAMPNPNANTWGT